MISVFYDDKKISDLFRPLINPIIPHAITRGSEEPCALTELVNYILEYGIRVGFASGDTSRVGELLNSSHIQNAVLHHFVTGELPNLKFSVAENDIILGIEYFGYHLEDISIIRKCLKKAKLKMHDLAPWDDNNATVVESFLVLDYRVSLCAHAKTLASSIEDIKFIKYVSREGLKKNLESLISSVTKYPSVSFEKCEMIIPKFFRWLQYVGQIPEEEMYEIFNMGISILIVISLEKMEKVKSQIENDEKFRIHMIGKFIF